MATIHDVAEHAGVSATTVSRYLNSRIDLPPATAARIDAAIALLDYRPNLLAKRLSTGRTEAISLVAPEIANPFFAELAAAIEDEAERHGYAVFMSSTRGDQDREVAALQRLRDRHVDGMIMMTNHVDDGTLAALIDGHAAVVLLDEDIPDARAPRVFVENERGTYLAARHLLAAGHTEIAYIGGMPGLASVEERYRGYSLAMREAGVTPQPGHIRRGSYGRSFGVAAARELFDLAQPPTAIVAASDYIAIGALQELRARNLSVPQDVSLVGFDDMPFADIIDPPLTTVRQPVTALGRLGFQTLLSLIQKQEPAPLARLGVQLIERASVGPPRQHAIQQASRPPPPAPR